ncbi:hypothetical protein EVAR_28278_1 [Eumeta japonica]|uniref:Uncharacterized protein n=1 Tax=Eumeta variegata TaxID=151549 RepID=A0A4C1V885_EUMVA|nr:hypothetical protein EVAR_28278_1 [Eumeta japonica]
MSGLTIRIKRGSRGSDTLLEAANRILRILGFSSTKRGKQTSPKSKVRSSTRRASRDAFPRPAPPAAGPSALRQYDPMLQIQARKYNTTHCLFVHSDAGRLSSRRHSINK